MSAGILSEFKQLQTRLVEIEHGQQDSKDLFAKIESGYHAAKVAILGRQARLASLARRLTNLDSLSSELRVRLSTEEYQSYEIRSSFAAAKSSFPGL